MFLWDPFGTMSAFLDFFKSLYIIYLKSYRVESQKLSFLTPQYIVGTYFDTKLSMLGLALSTTEEGAVGIQKGPKGPHRS